MSISRLVTLVLTGVAGSILVAGCSSAPEESRAQTSEALGGPTCPATGCVAEPICADNPTCATGPRDDANGYSLPWVFVGSGAGACHENTGFSEEMTNFGCQPEFYYQQQAGSAVEAAALCPGVPPGTVALPCDECTGVPPKGWTFVTWWAPGGDPCSSPSPGCAHIACATF